MIILFFITTDTNLSPTWTDQVYFKISRSVGLFALLSFDSYTHLMSRFAFLQNRSVRIRIGFHDFMEIDRQIFQNDSENQERGLKGVKIQNILGVACPSWTPLASL